MRERIACWYAAFVSTAIYLWLFWQVGLLMESALQVYYLLMAVYGWYSWRGGVQQDSALRISTLPLHRHLLLISAVLLLLSSRSTSAPAARRT